MMRRFGFSMILLVAICPLPAMAQIGVYGEFGAAKSNVPQAAWMYGPTFGVYYDPWHLPFFAAGLDARAELMGSGNNKLDSGLLGPRLVFRPHVLPIQPYVEGLLGFGHAAYTQNFGGSPYTTRTTQFEYQILGGLDWTIFPRLDWRAIEFGYGGLPTYGSTYNPEMISTGLVLRLP